MKHFVLMGLVLTAFFTGNSQHSNTYLFIGTYTDGKPGSGIYICRMNPPTGELTITGKGEAITNPSFFTIAPNGKYLLCLYRDKNRFYRQHQLICH
ncbi:MAG: beta-propeller fold lactonase family protein [Bacteroidota bacterium]